MADWIAIWNQSKRTEVRNRPPGGRLAAPGDPLGSIYVPWGQDLISKGDWIYPAGIEDGELMVIGRVCVGEVTGVGSPDRRVDVEAQPGTETPVVLDRFLPGSGADRLEFLKATGQAVHPRRKRGRILGSQFQGRASIRELVGPSTAILDHAIGPR